ncbi:hypothetical protein BJP36_41280 [Moorena producens JHB]|uniref:Uncharacterized protein n=1 Tax=Moorena producens (strain JHB) TaxID=1454205 RepID=A0A9Q9SSF3_MOOP1|nr:hypothetical protein [Moorena producens]WAN68798.1 hypothetical protein BJP36_41280 [Moorena producens JHB]
MAYGQSRSVTIRVAWPKGQGQSLLSSLSPYLPISLLPIPYSLLPTPYSLLPELNPKASSSELR